MISPSSTRAISDCGLSRSDCCTITRPTSWPRSRDRTLARLNRTSDTPCLVVPTIGSGVLPARAFSSTGASSREFGLFRKKSS